MGRKCVICFYIGQILYWTGFVRAGKTNMLCSGLFSSRLCLLQNMYDLEHESGK